MKVALDTSVLLYLVYPDANAPVDPKTNKPVAHCQERIEGLIEGFNSANTQLIVPTPVLSELLINAPDRQVELLAALTNKSSVQVVAFDNQAAIENAALRRSRQLLKRGRGVSKAEVKFDLQVLAIARVAKCEMIMTDDDSLRSRALEAGLNVVGILDLPVPESKRQIAMMLASPEVEPRADSADDDQCE